MPLRGIDHIELYVGNAVQAAHFFTHALGFRETAFAGLETGMRDRSSRVVEQGRIRFALTAPLHGGTEIARHVADHGDGVKVVALSVPDAEEAYRVAVRRGARGLREPHVASDGDGDGDDWRRSPPTARPSTPSSSATATAGPFLPGFEPVGEAAATTDCSPASTTWSATSSSAAWRSGSATTSASSASPR